MKPLTRLVNYLKSKVSRTCKLCGKKLEGHRYKFCGDSCRFKWHYQTKPEVRERIARNTRKRYLRMRDNPEFKKQSRDRLKRWIANHPERWKELMKKQTGVSNAINIKRYRDNISKGLCGSCGGTITGTFKNGRKYSNCEKCRKIRKEWQRRRKERKEKNVKLGTI